MTQPTIAQLRNLTDRAGHGLTVDEQQRLRDGIARLERAEADLAELTRARQHGAYTYCDQLVGHVNMTAFATKIAEKREAIGQRAEAVQYASEQKQRAERAEAERNLLARTIAATSKQTVEQVLADVRTALTPAQEPTP